jgi:F-type H+-transporting ATPase subunit gamma
VGLVVVTADKGLCGSYNSNIIRQAENFLNGLTPPRKGSLILLGRKGYDYFKRRQWEILLHVPELSGKVDRDRVKGLTEDIVQFFTSGQVSEVYFLYTRFISAMVYKPTLEKFLELERRAPQIESRELRYIYEPDFNRVWNAILPEYLVNKLYLVLTESSTSEYSARMIAMKAATDNAGDMMEQLTLLRNKMRQATITRELSEIVAGAQAL